jgi:hypothetical protein
MSNGGLEGIVAKIKAYISQMHLRNETICKFITRWALIYIGLLVLSPYAGFSLFYLPYGEYRPLIQASLLLIFFCVALSTVYSKLREVIFSDEVLLLKKLGFSADEFLVFCVFKMRLHFMIISAVYFVVFWSANTLSTLGVALCIFNSMCLFLVILFLSGLLLATSSKITAALKILVPLAMFCYVLGKAFSATDFSLPLDEMMRELLLSIGATPIAAIFARLFCQSPICLAALLIFLSAVFLLYYKKDFFYIDGRFGLRRKGKAPVKANVRHIVGSPLRSFLKRDLTFVFSNKMFIAMQLLFLIIGFMMLNAAEDVSLGLNLIIFALICWMNSLFAQELFAVDSKFSMWYKKLPLKFSAFMFARIVSIMMYSIAVPLVLLMAQLCLKGMGLLDFAVLAVAASFMALVFGLFVSSIILFFFPNVKNTTDLPLIIGNFLMLIPLAPFAVIFLGLKKGNRRWREW